MLVVFLIGADNTFIWSWVTWNSLEFPVFVRLPSHVDSERGKADSSYFNISLMLTPRFSFITSNLAKISRSDVSAIVVLVMLMGLASRQVKVSSLFLLTGSWNFVSSDWILVARKSFNCPALISSALRRSSWRSFGATRPDESPVIALLSSKELIQELMTS